MLPPPITHGKKAKIKKGLPTAFSFLGKEKKTIAATTCIKKNYCMWYPSLVSIRKDGSKGRKITIMAVTQSFEEDACTLCAGIL